MDELAPHGACDSENHFKRFHFNWEKVSLANLPHETLWVGASVDSGCAGLPGGPLGYSVLLYFLVAPPISFQKKN